MAYISAISLNQHYQQSLKFTKFLDVDGVRGGSWVFRHFPLPAPWSGLMEVLETIEGQCEEVLASWSKFSEILKLKYLKSRPDPQIWDISPFWGH
jgi:hypothetical protein